MNPPAVRKIINLYVVPLVNMGINGQLIVKGDLTAVIHRLVIYRLCTFCYIFRLVGYAQILAKSSGQSERA